MLTPGLANTPEKNLQTVRAARLCEKPDPRVNRAKVGMVVKYTAFRPKVSLMGEDTMGPNAIPRLKNERGKRARVVLMPNCLATASWPGA